MKNSHLENAGSMPPSKMDGKQSPVITVIIPTYRRPKLLQRAIRSALNQTYPHLQVCVYDNASGDETAAVVAEIAKEDSRVTYHCHKENMGPFNNFQYGLDHVDTPLFTLFADDDVLLPEFFEVALEGLEKHPDAMFSATDVIYMDETGEARGHHLQNHSPGYYPAVEGLIAMLEKGHLTWTGLLFRRQVIDTVGVFNEDAGMGDVDYLYRVAAKCPFYLDPRPGAIFVHSDQVYYYPKWHLQNIFANIREHNIPSDIMSQLESKLVRKYQRDHLFICMRYLRKGDGDNAWKVAQDLSKSPGNTLPYKVVALMVRLSKAVPFFCLLPYWMIRFTLGLRLSLLRIFRGEINRAANKKREDLNRLRKYKKYLLEGSLYEIDTSSTQTQTPE